jgi:hypothetical protein
VVLGVALAGNAAVAMNYPALVEAMDFEFAQRADMTDLLTKEEPTSLSSPQNGRITGQPVLKGDVSAAPAENDEWGNLLRGFTYLLYGRWLVLWALLGVLLGGVGSLGHRLTNAVAWGLLGLGLAVVVCWPRLQAEYYWVQAKQREAQLDLAGARQSLDQAIEACPEFDFLERTWLLAGKLDLRAEKPTLARVYFQAYQLARKREWERALALMEDVQAEGDEKHPAVRGQAARLLTAAGLSYYHYRDLATQAQALGEVPYADRDAQLTMLRASGTIARLAAAQALWRRAAHVDPGKRDTAYYLATVQARLDRDHPERVERFLAPALDGLADRILRADLSAVVGDAYFEAGDMAVARQRFAESFDIFSLAKTINFRALRGLGGL